MFISGAVGPGDHEAKKSSLWVVSILGGAPRRLRGDAFGAVISPDDKLVVFTSESGIWLAGPDGDDPRQFLAEGDDESLYSVHWSWSGDRIVYGRSVRHGDRWEPSIESRGLDGGSVTTLAAGPRLGSFLMLKDRLVFARGEPFPRTHDQNLWDVAVDQATGKPIGQPRRLTNWTGFGFANLTTTHDGRQLVFLKTLWQSDVYVGEIEDGGRSLGGVRRLSLNDMSDWPSTWTPDGKSVVYVSDRNGTRDIYVQGLDQRTASVLAAAPRELGGVRLTPDRASFLYWSTARPPDDLKPGEDVPDDPRRLMRIPVSGGPTELVLETSKPGNVRCSSVAGGGCVLIERDLEGKREIVSALDPVKGRGDELLSLAFDRDSNPAWDISPDGTRLVVVNDEKDDRSIRILDRSGKVVQEILLRGVPGATLGEIAWPERGSGFFIVANSPRGDILGFVETTGEVHVFRQAQSGGFANLKPSPDGLRLAFGVGTEDSNVWTIEGF